MPSRLVLQLQIVPADHGGDLAHLIGLGLTVGLLKVEKFGYALAREDTMTSPAADLLETKGGQDHEEVGKADIRDLPGCDPAE
jgi:hypothetical protein